MPFLPDEISEKILVRLPAKSLVRFNLVCKRWGSLISDPNFIQKHLNHVLSDRSNNHHKLIINSPPNFYSIDYESHNFTQLNFPFKSFRGIRIMGSCNGLLLVAFFKQFTCYCNSLDNLAIWNPIRGDYISLPGFNLITDAIRLLGFGYDSSTDDYKVVRVVTDESGPVCCIEHKVEIYSLKTNTSKMIQGIPYDNVEILNALRGGTFLNGSVYWLLQYEDHRDDWNDNLLLSFDFVNEKFRSVEILDDDYIDTKLRRSLVVVKGCLGLYQTGYNCDNVTIWILKEDEEKNEYWSKLMRIPKEKRMYSKPITFMKNDEVLLSVSGDKSSKKDKKLVVYDSKNMKYREFGVFGKYSVWTGDKMIYVETEMIYVETLVSPNGGKSDRLD